jgi:hypothetical protein
MDCVILLHFGGLVSEQFELVGIRPHMLTVKKPPSFNELIARVRVVVNVECELRLHRRYDMVLCILLILLLCYSVWG